MRAVEIIKHRQPQRQVKSSVKYLYRQGMLLVSDVFIRILSQPQFSLSSLKLSDLDSISCVSAITTLSSL